MIWLAVRRDKSEATQVDTNAAFEEVFRRKRGFRAGGSARKEFDDAVAHRPDVGRDHLLGGAFALGDVVRQSVCRALKNS